MASVILAAAAVACLFLGPVLGEESMQDPKAISYKMTVYNADGTVVSSADTVPSKYHAGLGSIRTEEMVLVEFVAR